MMGLGFGVEQKPFSISSNSHRNQPREEEDEDVDNVYALSQSWERALRVLGHSF